MYGIGLAESNPAIQSTSKQCKVSRSIPLRQTLNSGVDATVKMATDYMHCVLALRAETNA
jgi:hypothetical protein